MWMGCSSQWTVGVSYSWEHSEDTPFILFGRGLEGVDAATVWERMRRGKTARRVMVSTEEVGRGSARNFYVAT